jgi:outer membrane protein assembly factor BamB
VAFHIVLALLAGCLVFAAPAPSADWPQWRGPERNGVSRETNWLSQWPAGQPPPLAWTAAVGKGHAALSVSRGRAFTVGWDGRQDTVFCFDAASGRLLWRQSYPCKTILQWPGPRATPTVDGETVFTLGQHGQLAAWDAATGERRWFVQLPASYQPDADYGFAWSPLIEGELLLLGCGRGGLALHKGDGRYAWGQDGQPGACASPVPFTLGGQRGVALLLLNPGRNSVSLAGIQPQTGREWWTRRDWPEKWGAVGSDPLVHDGKLFVSTAEQHKRCARFSVRNGKLVEDWANATLSTYTSGLVLLDGYLYGVDKTGLLKCVDWRTGEEKWFQRGFDNHGTLIAADGRLILQTGRSGQVVVAEARPDGYRELRRHKVFATDAATFTPPVLAHGRLYCRSYAGAVVCLAVGQPRASRPRQLRPQSAGAE